MDDGDRHKGAERAARDAQAAGRPSADGFRPRFSFGLTTPMVTVHQDDLATAIGAPEAGALETDLAALRTDGASCQCSARLRPDDLRYVVMTSSDPSTLDRLRLIRQLAVGLVDETSAFWRRRVNRARTPESHRDAVVRSALVLKGLTDAARALAMVGRASRMC